MASQRGEGLVGENAGAGAGQRPTGGVIGTPDDELAGLTARVAEARRRIAAGDLPPLEELARSLSTLLSREAVQATAPAVARLTALQDEIGALLAAVAEQRELAGKRLGELTVRGRARRAYARGG